MASPSSFTTIPSDSISYTYFVYLYPPLDSYPHPRLWPRLPLFSPDLLQQPLNGSSSNSFTLLFCPYSTPFRIHFIKPNFVYVTPLLKTVTSVPIAYKANSLKAWFTKHLAIWPHLILPSSSPAILPHPILFLSSLT